MPEQKEPETVGEFLDAHYRKFAIVGIFGSVSVFVNKISVFSIGNERLALFGSLLIFLLVSIVIASHSVTQLFSNRKSKQTTTSVGFVVILIGIGFLMYAVASTVLTYSSILWLVGSIIVTASVLFEWEKKYPSSYYEQYDDEASARSALFGGIILLLTERRWLSTELFGTYHPLVEVTLVVLLWAGMTFLVSEVIIGYLQFEQGYHEFGKFGLLPNTTSKLIATSVVIFFIPIIVLNPAGETASTACQGLLPLVETWAQKFYLRWVLFLAGVNVVVSRQLRRTNDRPHWFAVILLLAITILSLYDVALLLDGWLI